jgi:hypothetical protein
MSRFRLSTVFAGKVGNSSRCERETDDLDADDVGSMSSKVLNTRLFATLGIEVQVNGRDTPFLKRKRSISG